MLERLPDFESELAEVEMRLADPAVVGDPAALATAARRHKELETLVACGRQLGQRLDDVATLKEMITDAGADDREILRVDLAESEAEVLVLEDRLRSLLLPSDPNDGKNVIVEIRGAEGGEEANLFARDLHDMYKAYAVSKGWKVEQLDTRSSDMGGFASVSFVVKGDAVWSNLKYEGGPHRVQRVPVTESQGRVHTSSATVSVLPEAEEVDVAVDPNDLEIDVYRSSGPGGQSVNTTDSAVRITHVPTGLTVSMQDEKSQLQNREKAMRVLRSRLLEQEMARQAAEVAEQRRDQLGGGRRSEKVRTYNYKENRVKDERVDKTFYNLDRILGGELDEVIELLQATERTQQLEEQR
ncbi:MAG: peptide chain release factor 1 [Acidimicrobiales bacterium]